ncbi:alpha/beta hydrolase [Sphingobium phenoxybenzoativorans]|uniref:Alpha/beta hydrolase n=1 Tax=Sphingobium phenoxybenzoativorans TaxID=1592790 RepID=A0A975Q0H0_9SPHN|nr:alpha/beta hydrolase [Sphingobium phenoxybenzoativorans]QUT04616.1 alpha/beta hydrolase [Sphingobium phenoxybenzoativorans]
MQIPTISPPQPAPANDSPVDGLDGFRHYFADVNGTRIHYVSGGAGPAVVLVHGWPYTWALWRQLMPLIADAGFTVIAPDLRGLGYSAHAEDGFSKVSVAEDIRAIVQSLGFATINLVGTDIGTMVAYAYASRHPEEIDHLVLAESLIPGFGLEELMNPATGGYWHFGFHAQADLAAFLTEGKESGYLLPTMSMMSASPDAAETAMSLFLPHYVAPGGMRQGFKHYATMVSDGQENRAAFTAKLAMPVLVLSGERGIPQAQTLACVEKVAANIQTDIVPASGHTFSLDNPVWVADRLNRFFKD